MGARRARPRRAERPAGPREHAAAAQARARAHRRIAVQVRRAQRGGRKVRHSRRVLKPHGGQALPASQRLRDGATAGSYQTCEGSEATRACTDSLRTLGQWHTAKAASETLLPVLCFWTTCRCSGSWPAPSLASLIGSWSTGAPRRPAGAPGRGLLLH
jgi:hypothetical protein